LDVGQWPLASGCWPPAASRRRPPAAAGHPLSGNNSSSSNRSSVSGTGCGSNEGKKP